MFLALARAFLYTLLGVFQRLFKTGHVAEFRTDLKASFVKYYRSREIAKIMAISHAEELTHYSRNEWPQVMTRHAAEIAAALQGKFPVVNRRSWSYPWLPESLHRLNVPILKNTPFNLRRFSETPIPRRAINLVKNTVVDLPWKLVPEEDIELDEQIEQRIRIGRYCLNHPNEDDSFRTLTEQITEDILVGGYGSMEFGLTPDYRRPFKLWPVDGSTIRIYADWMEGQVDRPRYAQMTGLRGERGFVQFLDDELIYIRDNIRTNTPFGLGRVEVAFNTINAFLGVQDMASKAGADQVHKTWLWWENTEADAQLQQVMRHLYHEEEGQAKVSVISGLKKPEIVEVQPVLPDDLLLEWQELLIRIIAAAFDLSPMALGLERDVNRNTSETMATSDFRSAVVPIAHRMEEAYTRRVFHKVLGWTNIKFKFIGLEDPDILTKTQIQQRQYAMNAITPDEIREDLGRDSLPSGLGKLTQIEAMVLIQDTIQKAAMAAQQGMTPPAEQFDEYGDPIPPQGGPGGAGGAMDAPGGGSSMLPKPKMMTAPMGGITASIFSARMIAEMKLAQIERLQALGMLPDDTNELADSMEEQEPGILETLSEQLQEFFEYAKKHKKEIQIKPAKVKPKDEKEQLDRYTTFNRRRNRKSKNDKAVKGTKQSLDRREEVFDRRTK